MFQSLRGVLHLCFFYLDEIESSAFHLFYINIPSEFEKAPSFAVHYLPLGESVFLVGKPVMALRIASLIESR